MNKLFAPGWYVLYVKSRQEKYVDKALNNIGLTSYLPIVKKLRQWSDRKKIIEVPLFSSYVFVYSKDQESFQKPLSVDGVCCYIKFGKDYAKVRDYEIENIKSFLNIDLNDVEVSNVPLIGSSVKVEYGPLAGLDCEVLQVKNKSKVIVEIKSINTNITATIPSCYLSLT